VLVKAAALIQQPAWIDGPPTFPEETVPALQVHRAEEREHRDARGVVLTPSREPL
jgi:hypothetical protein